MHNGDAGVTERANEGVVKTDLESEGQAMTWRPTEEDKKFIEEVVKSVVAREDLCRLLMIAMATELERPTNREDRDQSGTLKSPTHLVQFGADSPSEDFDHGDTAHDVSKKCERLESRELSRVESTKSAALEYLSEELMAESAGCDSEPAGDGDSVQTRTIVFDDATSDSLKSARSTATSPVKTVSLSAENLPQDVTGEVSAQDTLWFGGESCNTESGKSLDMELLDAMRATDNTTLIAAIGQENASLGPHQQALNSTACGLYQTVDNKNTYGSSPGKSQTLVKTTQGADERQTTVDNNSKSSLEFLLIQNLESLTVGSKHVSATTKKPAKTRVELPAKQLLKTETVPLLLTSSPAASDDANVPEFGTNGDIAVTTKPRQRLSFHGEKGEKRGNKYDHHDDPLSLAECGLSPVRLTEVAKERRSKQRSVNVDDDCRVTFRPLQVSVTSPKDVTACNPVLASTALRSCNATSTRTPGLPQSTGLDRKPRSSRHDVKCSQRRKSVAVWLELLYTFFTQSKYFLAIKLTQNRPGIMPSRSSADFKQVRFTVHAAKPIDLVNSQLCRTVLLLRMTHFLNCRLEFLSTCF